MSMVPCPPPGTGTVNVPVRVLRGSSNALVLSTCGSGRYKRAVQWHELKAEDELGERNCKCFELLAFRQHKLVLAPAVLPPGFAGGRIELQLVYATSGSKVELGGSKHLIDFELVGAGSPSPSANDEGRALAAAAPTATLRVDAAGESSAFGVAVVSHGHARERLKKFWLKLRWADGPAAGADVLGPFRLYFVSRVRASQARRPPPADAPSAPVPAPAALLPPPAPPAPWASAACPADPAPTPLTSPGPQAPLAPLGKRPPSGEAAPCKRAVRRCSDDAPQPPPAEPVRGLDEQFSCLALAAREAEASPPPPPAADSEEEDGGKENAPYDPLQQYMKALVRHEDRIRQIVLRVQSALPLKIEQEGSPRTPALRGTLESVVDLQCRVPMAHAAGGPAGGGPFPSLLAPLEAAALESHLRELHAEALAAEPGGDAGPANRLRDALADVRVLATTIVQDEMGGIEFKDMLQAVRAARRSDAGPQSVVSALLRAVLARGLDSLSREELEAAVLQLISFVECGGTINSNPLDLALLDPPGIDALARELLDWANLLGDPELKARAVAACSLSCAFARSVDEDHFVGALLEAWGLLKRHGLVPSRAEVEVMRALAYLLHKLNLRSARMKDRYFGLYADLLPQLYWYSSDRPRDIFIQLILRHFIAMNARTRGLKIAERQYETIMERISEEGLPRSVRASALTAVARVEQMVHSLRSLNIVRALKELRLSMEEERTHRLFHVLGNDWINQLRATWPLFWQPASLSRMMHVLAAIFKVSGFWGETPHSAHLLFALGDVCAVAGDLRGAAEAYEECLQMYGRFAEYFPPDCRRVVAARSALDTCRAALVAPSAPAGLA